MKSKSLVIFCSKAVLLMSVLLWASACRGYSATGGPGPLVQSPLTTELLADYDFAEVRDVAVLPLEGSALRSQPLTLAVQLQSELLRALAHHADLEVRNLTEPESFAAAVPAASEGTSLGRAIELNKRLDADGVFYGVLSRYRTPGKNELAPAEVSFRIWFLPRGKTQAVWAATYEVHEQPLSENLFRVREALKDGMGYRGAEKLTAEGFKKLAEEFAGLRSGPN